MNKKSAKYILAFGLALVASIAIYLHTTALAKAEQAKIDQTKAEQAAQAEADQAKAEQEKIEQAKAEAAQADAHREKTILDVLSLSRTYGKIRPFNLRSYGQEIEQIDASQCPENFRLAWKNYVNVIRDEASHFFPNQVSIAKARELCEDVEREYNIPVTH
jgi:multidrug efflux pump subunit AcrA (membrane-fusion protein)